MANLLKFLVAGMLCILLVLLLLPKSSPKLITPNTSIEPEYACSTEKLLVCGEDGKTYTNNCTAEKIFNVKVLHWGECKEETSVNIDTGSTTDLVSPNLDISQDSLSNKTGEIVDVSKENDINIPLDESIIDSSLEEATNLNTGTPSISSNQIETWLISYYNESYKYGFSLPKNSYYAAFGAQDGASHSVGINVWTGVDSLSNSNVQVYFYANKILPELKLSENGIVIHPSTGTTYILLGDKSSVRIESNSQGIDIVSTLKSTIYLSDK